MNKSMIVHKVWSKPADTHSYLASKSWASDQNASITIGFEIHHSYSENILIRRLMYNTITCDQDPEYSSLGE